MFILYIYIHVTSTLFIKHLSIYTNCLISNYHSLQLAISWLQLAMITDTVVQGWSKYSWWLGYSIICSINVRVTDHLLHLVWSVDITFSFWRRVLPTSWPAVLGDEMTRSRATSWPVTVCDSTFGLAWDGDPLIMIPWTCESQKHVIYFASAKTVANICFVLSLQVWQEEEIVNCQSIAISHALRPSRFCVIVCQIGVFTYMSYYSFDICIGRM